MRIFLLAVALATVGACASVPPATLMKLATGGEARVLESNPSDLALFLAVSKDWPVVKDAPVIEVAVRPRVAGAFERIDARLPMRRASAGEQHLAPTVPSTWRSYAFVLTPESAQRLRDIQLRIAVLRAANSDGSKGGSLSVGIKLDPLLGTADGVAAPDARGQTWLRTSKKEGFLALWNGRLSEVKRQLPHGSPARQP